MNKLVGMVVACVVGGTVIAGGDVVKKVPCGGTYVCTGQEAIKCQPTKCAVCDTTPCPEAQVCPVCEPRVEFVDVPRKVVEYVTVVRREDPRPTWLLAGTGGYVGDPLLGVGGGYRWRNGVEVLGLGTYIATNVERVSWSHTYGRGHHTKTYSGYRDVGQDGTWGGQIVVVVPAGR